MLRGLAVRGERRTVQRLPVASASVSGGFRRLKSTTTGASNEPPIFTYRTEAEYERAYRFSIEQPDRFWSAIGNSFHWFKPPPPDSMNGRFNFDPAKPGGVYSRWFDGGKINLCYNALDRHVLPRTATSNGYGGMGDTVAIHWEGPTLPGHPPTEIRTLTFSQLLDQVIKMSDALRRHGLRPGDRVTIMTGCIIPELLVTVLACARLGLVHSVLGWFGAQACADRIGDARPKLVVTCSGFFDTNISPPHGPETNGLPPVINSKKVVDEAVAIAAAHGWTVPNVLVIDRFGTANTSTSSNQTHARPAAYKTALPLKELNWNTKRDIWYHDFISSSSSIQNKPLTATDVPCVPVDSESPAVILYTSGSTGKPKGIVHSAAGYMIYSATSFKYSLLNGRSVSDSADSSSSSSRDVYFCPNVNWVFYGPLCNGTTQVLLDGSPFYPGAERIMQLVRKYRVSTLYPTANALRQLAVSDPALTIDPYLKEEADGSVLSDLKMIGSLGEPLSDAQWTWSWERLARKQIPIVDTWWQTEVFPLSLSPMFTSVHSSFARSRLMIFVVVCDV